MLGSLQIDEEALNHSYNFFIRSSLLASSDSLRAAADVYSHEEAFSLSILVRIHELLESKHLEFLSYSSESRRATGFTAQRRSERS